MEQIKHIKKSNCLKRLAKCINLWHKKQVYSSTYQGEYEEMERIPFKVNSAKDGD